MAKRTVEIRCLHCGTWFPSPIGVSVKTLDVSEIAGNDTRCPKCKQITACNPENMRIRESDGGFLGDKT